MRVAQLVHELLPQCRAALFEQLGAGPQRGARGPVATSPAAEPCEDRYDRDRGLGHAGARPLPASRVLAGEQSRPDESLQSVGEDVRGDPLDRVGLQLSEVAEVSEDDVAEDEQAPAIANTSMAALIGHSDLGPFASLIVLAIYNHLT
jgi:hypothetical protein